MAGSADLLADLAAPAEEAAPRLLGALLRHRGVVVRITEVEAYAGADDPGSHAYRGSTQRNAVMFGPPGHLYVYLIYGMHLCANVVCGSAGAASAVLIRAGEVVAGEAGARERRGEVSGRDLARGPARLASALGLTLALSGSDLLSGPVRLEMPTRVLPEREIGVGPRVGLRQAADRPWRFWVAGDPTVSAYRPAASRTRTQGPAPPS